MTQMSWTLWQEQVLNKIRRDYADILAHLTLDDIDWPSWRDLYDQGRSASDAVDYAFVRSTSNERRNDRRMRRY
jgi:hypothetical protein